MFAVHQLDENSQSHEIQHHGCWKTSNNKTTCSSDQQWL